MNVIATARQKVTNEFIHSKTVITDQRGGSYSPLKEGTLALPVRIKRKESEFIRLMNTVRIHSRMFQKNFTYTKKIEPATLNDSLASACKFLSWSLVIKYL